MHEYGLAEGVLATVRQRAAGRKVAGIRVRFGVKHAVDEESMIHVVLPWVRRDDEGRLHTGHEVACVPANFDDVKSLIAR